MSAPSIPAQNEAAARPRLDPVLLLLPAVAGGLLVTWGALAAGQDSEQAAVDLAVVWSCAAAAVVALSRPGLRVTGTLFAAIAATWLVYDLQLTGSPLLWTIGWVFAFVPWALLVQLVLSHPGGRPWSATARLIIAGAYVAAVGTQVVQALCWPDDRNLLLVRPDQQLADAIGQAGSVLGLAVAIAYAALIAARLLRLRGVARRAALPLLVGALLAVPVTIVRLAASTRGDFALYDRLDPADRLLTVLVPLGFLAGLVWSHLRRSGASSLVVELREGGVETLRERLARALGDPTLEVAYWVDGRAGYVDDAGRLFELPQSPLRAVTLVVAGGDPVAALVHDPALLDEPDLVEAVRATAALVLENERLAAEVRSQLAEVRASRARLVAAADEERRRLERDLHDGAQQRLVGLSLKLTLARSADPAAAETLAEAQDDLELALAELREFARGVHPSLLREDGLDAALDALARRTALPVEVVGAAGDSLPEAVELAAYFFTSEALTNVAKHARATRATVTVSRTAGLLTVAVADDGVGGARNNGGSGLAGLRDRLAALDGRLAVDSPPGRGTTLTATIPCAS